MTTPTQPPQEPRPQDPSSYESSPGPSGTTPTKPRGDEYTGIARTLKTLVSLWPVLVMVGTVGLGAFTINRDVGDLRDKMKAIENVDVEILHIQEGVDRIEKNMLTISDLVKENRDRIETVHGECQVNETKIQGLQRDIDRVEADVRALKSR